jgi:hypothetical protein
MKTLMCMFKLYSELCETVEATIPIFQDSIKSEKS